MHWIINEALRREAGFAALMDQIARQGIPHTLVRKPPRVGYLVAPGDDGADRPVMLEPIAGPVFVLGTTSMKAVSEAHGWSPGFVDAPGQAECLAAWGDHMLNAGARFSTLAGAVPPGGVDVFVRPDQPGKAFAGGVVRAADFEDWRRDLVAGGARPAVAGDTRVVISPTRTIWSEYRCIAADGAFVTGSRYRTGGRWAESPDVGARIARFAEARLAEWCPRRALCVDVADTPEGLKIVETNAVSSAGFYANDMRRFVNAIDALY